MWIWTAGEAGASLARLRATAPPQVGAFIAGGGVKSGCKPNIPLREKGLALGGWAHVRAARSSVQDKQAQQPCRVNCRRELVHRGRNAPVALVGGEWRGAMARRVREPRTDRSAASRAPPLGTHRA